MSPHSLGTESDEASIQIPPAQWDADGLQSDGAGQ